MPTKDQVKVAMLECQQQQEHNLLQCVEKERTISDKLYAPMIVLKMGKWILGILSAVLTAYLISQIK